MLRELQHYVGMLGFLEMSPALFCIGGREQSRKGGINEEKRKKRALGGRRESFSLCTYEHTLYFTHKK